MMRNGNMIMRLRYKISIIVVCFVVFYLGITPIAMICFDPINNCTFIEVLWINTRLTIPGGEGDIEYTGTVQGVEAPNAENFIRQNISFFSTMIVIPICIILVVIFFEKRL